MGRAIIWFVVFTLLMAGIAGIVIAIGTGIQSLNRRRKGIPPVGKVWTPDPPKRDDQ